jgi:hypothetical protein
MDEYKITSFSETEAKITVKYKNEFYFSLDLPIDKEGNIPTGENLDKYIKSYVPTWAFERKEKLKQGLKQDQIQYINSIVQIEEIVTNQIDPLLEEENRRNFITSVVYDILNKENILNSN